MRRDVIMGKIEDIREAQIVIPVSFVQTAGDLRPRRESASNNMIQAAVGFVESVGRT